MNTQKVLEYIGHIVSISYVITIATITIADKYKNLHRNNKILSICLMIVINIRVHFSLQYLFLLKKCLTLPW